MAGEDAAATFRAMQARVADPARSVPYLRMRLHPITAVDAKHLHQWIADLNRDEFAAREKATLELEKLGVAALPTLRTALEDKPLLETRRRLQPLIERLEREEGRRSGEWVRSSHTLEVLGGIGTPEAERVVTTLANGAPAAQPTMDAKAALQRLTKRLVGKR